jgi:hypothetical protein
LILLASSGYFLRNIGDNYKILEEIFSFLIRLIINGDENDVLNLNKEIKKPNLGNKLNINLN